MYNQYFMPVREWLKNLTIKTDEQKLHKLEYFIPPLRLQERLDLYSCQTSRLGTG